MPLDSPVGALPGAGLRHSPTLRAVAVASADTVAGQIGGRAVSRFGRTHRASRATLGFGAGNRAGLRALAVASAHTAAWDTAGPRGAGIREHSELVPPDHLALDVAASAHSVATHMAGPCGTTIRRGASDQSAGARIRRSPPAATPAHAVSNGAASAANTHACPPPSAAAAPRPTASFTSPAPKAAGRTRCTSRYGTASSTAPSSAAVYRPVDSAYTNTATAPPPVSGLGSRRCRKSMTLNTTHHARRAAKATFGMPSTLVRSRRETTPLHSNVDSFPTCEQPVSACRPVRKTARANGIPRSSPRSPAQGQRSGGGRYTCWMRRYGVSAVALNHVC